ncbi:hypothetical protein ACWGJW_35840, partial [Streptomyces nigrescens]
TWMYWELPQVTQDIADLARRGLCSSVELFSHLGSVFNRRETQSLISGVSEVMAILDELQVSDAGTGECCDMLEFSRFPNQPTRLVNTWKIGK